MSQMGALEGTAATGVPLSQLSGAAGASARQAAAVRAALEADRDAYRAAQKFLIDLFGIERIIATSGLDTAEKMAKAAGYGQNEVVRRKREERDRAEQAARQQAEKNAQTWGMFYQHDPEWLAAQLAGDYQVCARVKAEYGERDRVKAERHAEFLREGTHGIQRGPWPLAKQRTIGPRLDADPEHQAGWMAERQRELATPQLGRPLPSPDPVCDHPGQTGKKFCGQCGARMPSAQPRDAQKPADPRRA